MLQRLEFGLDCEEPLRLAPFWANALGYEAGTLDEAGYLNLVPPHPDLPTVYLQRVPEPKRSKNRAHLDLYVDEPDETVDRLLLAGATRVGEPRTGPKGGWWQVMLDPEGNEFCVCRVD